MDMNRLTIKLQEALQTASSHAARRSHQGIDVEHLLLAFVEQDGGLATSLLEQAGLSVPSVRQAVEQALAKLSKAAFVIGDVDPGEDDLLGAAVDLHCNRIADRFEGQ